MKTIFTLLTALLLAPLAALRSAELVTDKVDWPAFMARHDLVWEQLPLQWNEGAFTGNGQLGMMIYATTNDNRLDFHLGRADVTDHRKAPDRKTSAWAPGASAHYDFPRLDIGRMALRPAGKIQSGTLRQHLWNAEITGTLTTDLGEINFRAFTHATQMIDAIEIISTEKTAAGKPAAWTWEFLPGNPIAPRRLVAPREASGQNYVTNPAPQISRVDDVPVCVQSLLAGGDYATAWLEKSSAPRTSVLFVSTANAVPQANVSASVAVKTVRDAAAENFSALVDSHRAWWHEFYPHSFLSIPDAKLESFYWIQIYKLGAVMRGDGPLLDDQGPIFRINQWPYATWNLNVQLSYWPVYAANHLELGESLTRYLDAEFPAFLANRRNNTSLGDLAWVLHNYWWQVRFAADDQKLRAGWFPKATQVAAAYLAKLKEGPDGKLHLPPMLSPEYSPPPSKNAVSYPDSNYNLALCRWLFSALLETDARCKIASPDAVKWRDALARLTPFPQDENGLCIGADQPFAMSHRHFSHLLALYPLFQLNPDAPEDRALVEKSVAHWHHIEGGKLLAGYSFTGGAALYAALGKGDEADAMLKKFFRATIGISHFLPNTMYAESGGKNPTIETPLAGASATIDLLLQSWGGTIRIFPAVPTAWADAQFHDLRALGGFLVSARRENGKTQWVSIRSLAGEPCRIKVADWTGELSVTGARPVTAKPLGSGQYELNLKTGEQVVLCPKGNASQPVIEPIAHRAELLNCFGVKKGQQLPPNQFWPER
jgi:hypothetical protein